MSSYCYMQAQIRKVYKALKEEEDEDFAWDTGWVHLVLLVY